MNADEWAEIRRCHAEGETIKGIAGRLRMSRNTVRRALAMTSPPEDHRSVKGSLADEADDEPELESGHGVPSVQDDFLEARAPAPVVTGG